MTSPQTTPRPATLPCFVWFNFLSRWRECDTLIHASSSCCDISLHLFWGFAKKTGSPPPALFLQSNKCLNKRKRRWDADFTSSVCSVSGSVRGAEALKTPTLNMRIIAHRIPSCQLSTARLRFITQEVTHHPPPQPNHVLCFPRPNSAADRPQHCPNTQKHTHAHKSSLSQHHLCWNTPDIHGFTQR